MRFNIGNKVLVKNGSVLDFKDNHSYDYGGAKGNIIGLNANKDGYIVKFDARSVATFDADHMRFVRDNYTHDDRVIFYDRHLEIYVNSWIDNLKNSWCV